MKKDIHPHYHEVTFIRPNGEKFIGMSTMKETEYHLDSDISDHPAWTGKMGKASTGGQVDVFNKRFAGFDPFATDSSDS